MADSRANLKLLKEEHDHYNDVYLSAFYKIAKKDVIFEEVVKYFDVEVMKRLTDVFAQNEEFVSLGIGVGKGLHEFNFLKSLQHYYKSLRHVAVDPNLSMLNIFKNSLATLDTDSLFTHWFDGPLSQFLDQSPLARNKFNLITAIHSLYYTGDFETTFTQMAPLLKDNGIMIFVCHTEDNMLQKTFSMNSWLPETTCVNDQLSSRRIRDYAESLGYDVITTSIPLIWDITEVFDGNSDFGNKLLDFFTQSVHFRQIAPKHQVDDLMSFWRSISMEDRDGRIVTSGDSEILLISK